jgi:hypothetical protein
VRAGRREGTTPAAAGCKNRYNANRQTTGTRDEDDSFCLITLPLPCIQNTVNFQRERSYRSEEYSNNEGMPCVVWLRISRHYLRRALVRGRSTVFSRYYSSLAKSAGKDFRGGAVVLFE